MSYADFQASDQYRSKVAGASYEVLILNEADPSDVIIGKTTGLNLNEDYESLPVEEGGEDGVNEIVQGRHAISGNVPALFTPERNDRLPSRLNFIGKTYSIIQRIGEDWPGAGQVIQVVTGAKISRRGDQSGARGLVTLDLAFVAKTRYTGKQWNARTGS